MTNINLRIGFFESNNLRHENENFLNESKNFRHESENLLFETQNFSYESENF